MSMNNLSMDGELRYIVQWFSEWSELQREDFVPILVEYLLRDTPTPGVYMNGIVNSLNATYITNKPMSLFQCRIKLFREWNPKWPEEFKNKLKERVCEIDSRVADKIAKCLVKHQNGDVSNEIDAIEEFPTAMDTIAANAITTATSQANISATTSATVSASVTAISSAGTAIPTTPVTPATINMISLTRPYIRHNQNIEEVKNDDNKEEKEETEEEIITETSLNRSIPIEAPIVPTYNATPATATDTTTTLIGNTEPIDSDHNLAEVLRKETPVDDHDDNDPNNDNHVELNNHSIAVNNSVQDNITRVTLNATTENIVNDVTFGNGLIVEPVEQDQVEHVVSNSSPVTVNVSVATTAEVPLVA